MSEIILNFAEDHSGTRDREKGIVRLMDRCPWLVRENWDDGDISVVALGHSFSFPQRLQCQNRYLYLCGDVMTDDVLDRLGRRGQVNRNQILNLLMDLWKEKGKESLCGLNGRYSLIAWDKEKKELNVATDFLDNRHIYHLKSGRYVSFSTNLSILTEFSHFNGRLDRRGIAESLCLGYQLEERTLFEGIKCSMPSSLTTFKDGRLENYRNVRLQFSEPNFEISWEDSLSEFNDLLVGSFKKRSRRGQNLIIPLSGGLDSRCMAGLSHKMGFEPEYFSYGNKGCPDLRIAPQIASALGKKTKILPNTKDYLEKRWGDSFLFNGAECAPNINVFVDFLEKIGPNRGKFVSGFLADVVTYSHVLKKEPFFSKEEIKNFVKDNLIQEHTHEIPGILQKIKNEVSGLDYQKNIYQELRTRQRRYASFQVRLLEMYGGLSVPFEDIDIVSFLMKMPYLALENQELYKRYQVHYFPEISKILNANNNTPLKVNSKYILKNLVKSNLKRIIKIRRINQEKTVDHGLALSNNNSEILNIMHEKKEVFEDIFNIEALESFIFPQKSEIDFAWKRLALLHVFKGALVGEDKLFQLNKSDC